VLRDGDEVEVTGVPTREYVADGLRDTAEILAFRGGAVVRGRAAAEEGGVSS
jgi:hypothetical protein